LIRIITKCLAYLIYLIITAAILLEIVFRLLPTSSPVDLQPISEERDILRFKPNQKTTLSLGKNFYKVVEKSTNNYGFYSSYNYVKNSKPYLAIIGDSMIEAAQIKNEDTLGELIQSEYPDIKVYQFGVAGVPLSQYIKMIEYVEREFSPKHYAITVVGNDFYESLCSYRIKEGTWCFNDSFDLIFNPFLGYRGLRAIARKSAVMRYFVFNANLNWRQILVNLGLNDPGLKAKAQYTDNNDKLTSKEIDILSKRAIQAFFKKINEMKLADRVTIIQDADRNNIYNRWGVTKRYYNEMRSFMKKSAITYGVSYIDMDPVFRDDYAIYKKSFQFPTDGHWNEHAHKLASKELLKEILHLNK
jgi:hypothetical protein